MADLTENPLVLPREVDGVHLLPVRFSGKFEEDMNVLERFPQVLWYLWGEMGSDETICSMGFGSSCLAVQYAASDVQDWLKGLPDEAFRA